MDSFVSCAEAADSSSRNGVHDLPSQGGQWISCGMTRGVVVVGRETPASGVVDIELATVAELRLDNTVSSGS